MEAQSDRHLTKGFVLMEKIKKRLNRLLSPDTRLLGRQCKEIKKQRIKKKRRQKERV